MPDEDQPGREPQPHPSPDVTWALTIDWWRWELSHFGYAVESFRVEIELARRWESGTDRASAAREEQATGARLRPASGPPVSVTPS